MNTKEGRSFLTCLKFHKLAMIALATLLILGIAIFFHSGLADIEPVRQRAVCSQNLKQLYLGIRQYTSQYSPPRTPATDNGFLSLKLLFTSNRQPILANRQFLSCPGRQRNKSSGTQSFGCDYLVVPHLSVNDPDNKIIICDKPGNHADGGNVLYWGGYILFWKMSARDYRIWATAFVSGDKTACMMSPKEWIAKTKSAEARNPAPSQGTHTPKPPEPKPKTKTEPKDDAN